MCTLLNLPGHRPSLWTAAILSLVIAAGCGKTKTEEPAKTPKTEKTAKTGKTPAAHTHSHEGDDALVWVGQPRMHEGYTIKLGHHGEHLHAGGAVEPAVAITRDGEPVADANVANSLLSADGTEVLAAVVPTVYEPTTPEEEAHYAQGELKIPADIEKAKIHFVIKFADDTPEAEFDIDIDLLPADE